MKNFKFRSEDHISGLIDHIIYDYSANVNSINENYELTFIVGKQNNFFSVSFYWQGEEINIVSATHDQPRESEFKPYEDEFTILEDESISKLEQFVTDVLSSVVETELTYR